ncbi:hypothetical protein TanjilG_14323 [Lupinus angustifolius]|uniref:Uncharacterized protein n=1 Tax=Lupinus angustifolius TaxID=3871 RepID=A0A1J7HG08_LUPAN|nr:hypothetical protein TanjilG_14323 [Lupinus angustifolius]
MTSHYKVSLILHYYIQTHIPKISIMDPAPFNQILFPANRDTLKHQCNSIKRKGI